MQRNYRKTLDNLRSALATAPANAPGDEPFSEELIGRTGAPARFQPSGNDTLDAIVRAARPTFFYGAAPGTIWPGDSHIDANGVICGEHAHIAMPYPSQCRSAADYRTLVAHELVHWTKSKGRADRPHGGMTGWDRLFGIIPAGYAREEMVAEIGAALLLDYCGEPQDLAQRASYINNWGTAIDGDDERAAALEWATGKARAAVDYLLSLAGRGDV